jgi:hypothetical protein
MPSSRTDRNVYQTLRVALALRSARGVDNILSVDALERLRAPGGFCSRPERNEHDVPLALAQARGLGLLKVQHLLLEFVPPRRWQRVERRVPATELADAREGGRGEEFFEEDATDL